MVKTFNFHLNEENADQWYSKLNDKEKQKIQNTIKRMNSNIPQKSQLPSDYIGISERINAQGMTDESIYALDQTILKTLYQQDTFAQIIANTGITTSDQNWTNKVYSLEEDNVWPSQGMQTFRDVKNLTIGLSKAQKSGYGYGIAYEIPWEDIVTSNGGLYSPEFYHAMIASERMGIVLDEAGFWGTGAPHGLNSASPSDNDAGLLNNSNVGSFTAASLTTYGNVYNALLNAASSVKGVYQNGKIVLITTSGVASQTLINKNSYGDAELDIIQKYIFGRNIIDEWWITERVYRSASDPTNSQQLMAIAKIGPTLQKNNIVFPLQTKPMLDKKLSEDIKEMIIYGNNFVQYGVQKHPVSIASGLTTTGTGFIENGRFL